MNNILIVEKTPPAPEMTGDLIASLEIDVTVTNDGLSAIKLIHGHDFDLILADIQMPQMDWLQFLQLGQDLSPESRFILMGDSVEEYSSLDLTEATHWDFLEKPLNCAKLKIKLARFIRERKFLENLTDEIALRKQTEKMLEKFKTISERQIAELKKKNKLLKNKEAQYERALKKFSQQKEGMKDPNIKIQELNTTLKVLLKNRDDEKQAILADIEGHMSKFVTPCLTKLRAGLMSKKHLAYVDCVAENIQYVYLDSMPGKQSLALDLTAAEMRIANFIKQNKTNKDIAHLSGVSVKTVEKHRNNIRKKLGINNQKINLKKVLLSTF